MTIILHGYRYSVYNRVVRMVLAEKGIEYKQMEVDPFTDLSPDYLALHPFGRVPTLVHDEFSLYETSAIIGYLDEAFPGPDLQPKKAQSRARMAQIISVIDSYGYWPMIRQVFSQRVFGPNEGCPVDENEVQAGLTRASVVLNAIENIAGEGKQLVDKGLSLADIHLAPMIAYFAATAEGKELISGLPKLATWWEVMATRPSLLETDPGLPG